MTTRTLSLYMSQKSRQVQATMTAFPGEKYHLWDSSQALLKEEQPHNLHPALHVISGSQVIFHLHRRRRRETREYALPTCCKNYLEKMTNSFKPRRMGSYQRSRSCWTKALISRREDPGTIRQRQPCIWQAVMERKRPCNFSCLKELTSMQKIIITGQLFTVRQCLVTSEL